VNEVTLAWQAQLKEDGGSKVTAYELQSRFIVSQIQKTPWKPIVGLEPATLVTTFTDKPTDNTNKIQYRVRSKNRWGCSDF
jgi:hypothetical protein